MGVKEWTLVFVAIGAVATLAAVATAWLNAVAACVTATVAVFAVWYGRKIYEAQSGNKAYLSITLEAEVGERCDGSAWILVNAVLHNPSKIRCVPQMYRWKIWDVSRGEEALPVDDCKHCLPKGKIELEPGEVYTIPFIDMVVPKELKVLTVYFGIPYGEENQGLEWGKKTLIRRRREDD